MQFSSQAVDFSDTASSLSSRTTTHIGAIDGQRAFRGTLIWFNLQQTLRSSLERDASVQIALSPISQNANLYLLNESGRVIASSTRPGLAIDPIQRSLMAGDYSLIVAATSLRPTSYR